MHGESTDKFWLALALELQLRKFNGAESECATGPYKKPGDVHELAGAIMEVFRQICPGMA